MKEYKFLKDHNDYKEGDVTANLDEGTANYLLRCNVIMETKSQAAPKKAAPKKNEQTR